MTAGGRLTVEPAPVPAAGWFPRGTGEPRAGLRLVCFSYAGGSSSVFRDWAGPLGRRVQVVPVQLPGRGLRMRETPYTAMGPLVADVVTALTDGGVVDDYALFGHSMGALLGYEVACELARRGRPEPRHLFVSGSRAPQLYGDRADHAADDDQLRRFVHDLGGLAGTGGQQVADGYLDRRLPVLRADLQVCDTYRWRPRPPLRCPVTAFSGTADPIATAPEVEAWRECTTGSMLRRQLSGDHFFLLGGSQPRLLRDIRGQLEQVLSLPTGTTTP